MEKNIDLFNQVVKKVRKMASQELFHDAIEEIDRYFDEGGYSESLHVRKLMFIQLLDDDFDKYGSFEDIEKEYEAIIKSSEDTIFARVEYMHFEHAIMSNPENAIKTAKGLKKYCQELISECDEVIEEATEELNWDD